MTIKKENEAMPDVPPEKHYLIDFEEDPKYKPLLFILGQYLPLSAGLELNNACMGFEGFLVKFDVDEQGIYYEFES